MWRFRGYSVTQFTHPISHNIITKPPLHNRYPFRFLSPHHQLHPKEEPDQDDKHVELPHRILLCTICCDRYTEPTSIRNFNNNMIRSNDFRHMMKLLLV
ncbi:hypothetical protein Hanom_Chr01g00070221 [Helianthus anomalus]